MKFKLYLQILFIGWVSGLQAPLHYKYKYFGSITNGIPELSNVASGFSMKAEVNVYVLKDDGEAVFEINNVKIHQFVGELNCDSRGEKSDEDFGEFEDPLIKKAIETPFKAHLFQYEDYALEYEDDGYHWLLNMRKGIVSVFRNEILKGNIEKQVRETVANSLHEGHVVNVFSVEEETIFGKCTVHYTIHPFPEYIAATKNRYLEKHYEQDVQRFVPESSAYTTKTSKKASKNYTSETSKKSPQKYSKTPAKFQRSDDVPEIKDDLWHVVRSVDFDNCKENVGLQANTFDATNMNGGQHDWRRSRSSVSEFIFKGSAGHFRLEKAVVEGARTMSPYGFKTELLQSRSNQTFQLISIESAQSAPYPTENLKHSNTWMQEFRTSSPKPKDTKVLPWMVYDYDEKNVGNFQMFGMPDPSDELVQLYKTDIIEAILSTIPIIIRTSKDYFPTLTKTIDPLISAITIMGELPTEEIVNILTYADDVELMKKSESVQENPANLDRAIKIYKQLAVDIAASSGVGEAYEAIIKLAKEGKVSPFDVMTTYMTLASNADGVGYIPMLLDYVLTLDIKEHPFTTSTILVNFAYFLNKMSFSPQAKTQFYYGALSPHRSIAEIISKKFIPYLENIIFNEESTWERNVAIITLRHLGSYSSYSVISSIITEEKMKFPDITRLYAIESLDGRIYSQYNVKEPAMNLLTELYTKVSEGVSIRESAVHMITTWEVDSHFFNRLARMSWRDPSKQFSSLLTSMLETMKDAKMPEFQSYTQAASHAIKFARPVAPSFKYNYMKTFGSNFVDKYMSTTHVVEWLTSDKTSKPSTFYYALLSDFGGFQGNQVEIDIDTEPLINLYEKIFKHFHKEEGGKLEGISSKVAENFYDNIEETIKSHIIQNNIGDPGDIYMSLVQHMKYFLPNFVSTNFLPSSLNSKFELNFAKFISPINVRSAYPTELGLPIFLKIFAPILTSAVGNSELHLKDDFSGGSLDFQVFTRMIVECHSSIGVLLPWNETIASVKVLAARELNLPLNGSFYQETENGEKKLLRRHLDLQTPDIKPIPLLAAASVPLVAIHSLIPGIGTDFYDLIEIPHIRKRVKIPNEFSGLDIEVEWFSKLEFPFTLHKVHEIMKTPSSFFEAPFMPLSFITPTLSSWILGISLNAESSSTKNISIDFTKGKFGKSEPDSFTQERGEFTQYGQEGIGQYDQEQEGVQQGNEEFQVFDGSENVEAVNHLTYEDSIEQREEKLQNIYRGPGYLKSLKLSLDGTEHRSFEVFLSSAKSKETESRRLKKSGITLIRSPIPKVDPKPALVCVNSETSLPSYSKLFNLKDYSSDDSLRKEVKIDVALECSGTPILVLEGVYKVSDGWASKLQNEVPKYCNYDQNNEIDYLHSHAVYDDVKLDLSWKNVCDLKYPLTTKTIKFLESFANRLSDDQCYTVKDDYKIHVELHRCPITGNWDLKTVHENHEETFKQLPHNHLFSHVFSIGRKSSLELHPEVHSLFNEESDKCALGLNSVRTFDGFTYEYKPSQCWSVAFKVCNIEKGPMLLIRSPDTESVIPDMKYIDVQRGIVVEYTNHEIKVNGKIIDPIDGKENIKDDEGLSLLTIIKKNDFFMVKFQDFSYVSAKHRLSIHAPRNLAGTLCGMCGNFNGEPEDDLVGPHRCPYSDPDMFVASFTGNSDKCDLYSLLELREGAEKYQNQCTTMESFYESRPPVSKQCYDSGRRIKDTQNDVCVSQHYIPYCKDECTALEYSDKEETFFCWSKHDAPPALSEIMNSLTPVTDIEYKYQTSYSVKIPKGCIPT